MFGGPPLAGRLCVPPMWKPERLLAEPTRNTYTRLAGDLIASDVLIATPAVTLAARVPEWYLA
jgi:hypothetical protein